MTSPIYTLYFDPMGRPVPMLINTNAVIMENEFQRFGNPKFPSSEPNPFRFRGTELERELVYRNTDPIVLNNRKAPRNQWYLYTPNNPKLVGPTPSHPAEFNQNGNRVNV